MISDGAPPFGSEDGGLLPACPADRGATVAAGGVLGGAGGDPRRFLLGDVVEVVASIEELYLMGKTIGRGEFAKVKVARCKRTGRLVAIKIINVASSGDAIERRNERMYREIAIISRLNHPHIIKLLRVLRLPDQIAMVMEYASEGELFDYVQRRGYVGDGDLCRIMGQIFSAVEYLHGRNIVHRDLKLENLLCGDHGGRVYLSDFGFATTFCSPNNATLHTSCGSPCYAAPELVLCKSGYNGPLADVWSCGVIMYAMAYGHLPFEGDLQAEEPCGGEGLCTGDAEEEQAREGNGKRGSIVWTPSNVFQLYDHITRHPVRLPRSPAGGLSRSGQDLLLRLLQPDPERRIRMDEIQQHPWLAPRGAGSDLHC